MPVTHHWAFFAHAAVAPMPRCAVDAMTIWATDVAEHGVANEPRWNARVQEVRELAARLLHADPEDVAFVKNTSEGVGIVAEGIPWKPGDNVVTASDEYPANVYPWLNLARKGVETRLVPPRDGRLLLDDVRAAIDGRTRLVSLSWVEFATGFRNDLDALGQLCRERGVYFFVDGIQGLGVRPLDVRRTPVDFLAADGHKWLLGPEGAGVLYVRRELVDVLEPVDIGWNSVVGARDFSTIDFRLKPHAGRWESGSLNVAGITALGASIDLLLRVGVAALEQRILELTEVLCDKVRTAGLEVYSSRRPGEASGIVSVTVPGGEAELRRLVKRCRQAGVLVNHRGGRLRVSPHAYNTVEEIDRLLEVIACPP
jgi:selenocysteine lyase/cysteine desulfurase